MLYKAKHDMTLHVMTAKKSGYTLRFKKILACIERKNLFLILQVLISAATEKKRNSGASGTETTGNKAKFN